MRQNNVVERLYASVIHLVAKDGISNVTTKSISRDSNVNENYLYRYFVSKDDLMIAAFTDLDSRLESLVYGIIKDFTPDDSDGWKQMFKDFWCNVDEMGEESLFYMRMRNSSYYNEKMVEQHNVKCDPVYSKFRNDYPNEENVDYIVQHIFATITFFIAGIQSGTIENNEVTEEMVFRFLTVNIPKNK